MGSYGDDIIACDGLGGFMALNHPVTRDACCRLSDQNSTGCRNLFAPTGGLLDRACLAGPGICRLYDKCRFPETLYVSAEQTDEKGNGSLLLARYRACANLPNIARLSSERLLAPYIEQTVQKHLRLGPIESEIQLSLQQMTSSVTDCLSSTCRSARENGLCYDSACTPVKIISNSTSPNIAGINDCLWNICNAGTKALPWADDDILGIGVFSSYVMQCALVFILWAGLALFSWYQSRRHSSEYRIVPREGSRFSSWISLLLEFHKAQCYFSGTLMIAVIVSNIFDVDLVIAFLIIPLATNSILPVIFGYFLLVYYQASSTAMFLLTLAVYILSSVVYWVLYSHLPLSLGMTRGEMYKRFRLKASSISACGEFSGLAVCPPVNPGSPEFQEGIEARKYLRVLTPLIWGWATFVFASLIGWSVYSWRRDRPWGGKAEKPASRRRDLVFWLTSLVFLAGVAMQISVLSTAIKLNMVDGDGWSFGQVVAVTIWIPPVLEYLCGEMNRFIIGGEQATTDDENRPGLKDHESSQLVTGVDEGQS